MRNNKSFQAARLVRLNILKIKFNETYCKISAKSFCLLKFKFFLVLKIQFINFINPSCKLKKDAIASSENLVVD